VGEGWLISFGTAKGLEFAMFFAFVIGVGLWQLRSLNRDIAERKTREAHKAAHRSSAGAILAEAERAGALRHVVLPADGGMPREPATAQT